MSAYLYLSSPAGESDLLTEFAKEIFIGIYHSLCGSGRLVDEEAGLVGHDELKISTASNVVATVLPSILPVITIFALNILPTTNQRIRLTVLFTAVFAFFLATLTSAKRVEIFDATATYAVTFTLLSPHPRRKFMMTEVTRFAAIAVVFIGSAISSTSAAAASTNITVPGAA